MANNQKRYTTLLSANKFKTLTSTMRPMSTWISYQLHFEHLSTATGFSVKVWFVFVGVYTYIIYCHCAILFPIVPASCQHYCQETAPCQDEEDDGKYKIGLQAACEHHCQVPESCQDQGEYEKYKVGLQDKQLMIAVDKNQDHVKLKKNVRNTRLD
ncbi:hypothetical protein K492DRAFT_212053 [Lichtheimia hyalospora FSU 10163]|nr:hypothetical protein K492DRAFT_212053 [Lichtheimia hyalospora FSU 10163]